MTGPELIAVSLGLSIGVAATGGLAGAALERLSGDAGLRERAWAAALCLPALPPLAVALLLLTPGPVRTVVAAPIPTLAFATPEIVSVALAPAAAGFSLDGGAMATAVLTLAALMIAARLVSLAWRARRLTRLIARTTPASPEAEAAVAAVARTLGVAAPIVRACATGSDALLAGLVRPVLVLPMALAGSLDAPAARAVITHELAHLKRGDHRAVWLEEGLLTLLAFNPILPAIRARRAAAREEACDALALAGAGADDRRAYAQSLIAALRARTNTVAMPALTFTGIHRSQAMRRLKSILTPPATAGWGTRMLAVAAGLGLLATTGLATAAVAFQREAEPSLLQWVSETTPQQADAASASGAAQSAARAAARAAANTLTPEQRGRYRNPSVADYRRICASDDPADDGFCSGVIFSQLGNDGVCAPDAINDDDRKISGPALGALVGRTKAQFDEVLETEAATLPQLALSALQRAFPCPAPSAGRVDLAPDTAMTINGSPVARTLPFWALAATNVEVRTAEAAGGPAIDFIVPVTASPPVYVDGVRLPRGVGVSALKAEAIDRAEPRANGSIHVRLKPRPVTPVASAEPSTEQQILIAEGRADVEGPGGPARP